MAAAAPTAAATAPAPTRKKSRLLTIVVIVLAVALAGAGTLAVVLMKKSGAQHEAAQAEAGKPPTFHPLDVFTVNLADRDRERFLQANIALEVKDGRTAERIKAFNPVIRDRVLMLLSSQTADQIATVEGKEGLARAIVAAINKVIAGEPGPDAKPEDLPVAAAHFSAFVVQ